MSGGRGEEEGRKEWSRPRRYGDGGEVLCSILGDGCDGDGCSCCEGGCVEDCERERARARRVVTFVMSGDRAIEGFDGELVGKWKMRGPLNRDVQCSLILGNF